MAKKLISIVTPCYNEDENIEKLYHTTKEVMQGLSHIYDYEHIFIDNSSMDRTVEILRSLAKEDLRVKVILNSRNFGHIRSPVYGIFQAKGDAVISIVADLQDPPQLIPNFIDSWTLGNEIVLGIKSSSDEKRGMFKVRTFYYSLLKKLSEVDIYKNFTGFGLYDRSVIKALRQMNDPYPFFRGMISEVGYKVDTIEYNQPTRFKGITKNNFYTLYDIGVLGIINNSKIPLRLAIFVSMTVGVISLLTALFYFILKLLFWDSMTLGIAPLVIGGSLAFSVLLFFIGIIGEYIGAIYTQTLNRPLVFERERINF